MTIRKFSKTALSIRDLVDFGTLSDDMAQFLQACVKARLNILVSGGIGAITIRDLVKNSLRMRPDRIIVGEVRAGEALDMLQTMNTGHDGSLTTAHANTPRDVLSRPETMVLMAGAGMDLPVRKVRTQVASAIDLILQ